MIISRALFTFAAVSVLPAAALAFEAGGTGYGSAMSEAVPIHEGLVVVRANTQYDRFETMDADSPLAGATGPCWGAVIIDKGAVSGGGACHYTDADGDQVVMRWTPTGVADGRTQGTWEVVGGTGKWMAASGGGEFNAGGDGDDYTNMITGDVTME